MDARVYYDGDCPFCQRYVLYTRLQALGIELVDLRESPEDLARFQAAGYPPDEGMILELEGRCYHGADAMERLANLGTRIGWFNRLNYLCFSRPWLAALLYPVLRAGRTIALFSLGRSGLASGGISAGYTLFASFWGLTCFLHALGCIYDYGMSASALGLVQGVLGAALFIRPANRQLFVALLLVWLTEAWIRAPILSNHANFQNSLAVAMLVSGLVCLMRGKSWAAFFEYVAPIGRTLLCLMYVFGVFHKINRDFINPEVSCAVALWEQIPYLRAITPDFAHYGLIYGTFVVEGVILLCLLVRPWRHYGVLLGIAFHSLLALSGYALYFAFSTLSISLHLLFLSNSTAGNMLNNKHLAFLTGKLTPARLIGLLAYLGLIWLGYWLYAVLATWAVWFVLVGALLMVLWQERKLADNKPEAHLLWSRQWWLNAVSVLFFISCIAPYLGAKTAQSVNMFANLRLEAGVSNHLILSDPPGPFGYLEDIVYIKRASGASDLSYIANNNLAVTYYDLLDELERHRDATVDYTRNGRLYVNQGYDQLENDIDRLLHPRWFRKWFHFAPVDTILPKPCARDR